MPITKEEVTKCVCDRCGHEADNKDDKGRTPYEYGALTLKGRSQYSAQSLGGDWGGNTTDIDFWLCLMCKKAFWEWMHQENPNAD